ncbi:RNA-guided endonuclease TnpB family protein [Secundilactobacillus similis]|uniref:Is607 family transposase n=1 Tax=Secundilactobacillus similis DSM 23365 = JCM 2765 TaxID=1423804 RepID=A0A0R2F2D7_9LACO|nr:RNA-guided endonuclease TnpB family protein [Secundilactobacillus similis]KRN21974.1 is607 family transposase [Secundilactobacillus similis DSM 23365 = JCM 2765]
MVKKAKQSVVIKVKLKLHRNTDADLLTTMMQQYRNACNFVSQAFFDDHFRSNTQALTKRLYHQLRHDFHLKAQLAQSVVRTVMARYKAVETQLGDHPYCYPTGEKLPNGRPELFWVHRDCHWLWQPINFSQPQTDLQRGRDWSFLSNGDLSINTLEKRIRVTPVCHGLQEYLAGEPITSTSHGFEQYLDGTWKFGVAKILHIRGKWYLHIAMTKDTDELHLSNTPKVVGIDRGLRFLVTTYDHQQQTTFVSGKTVQRKRSKFKKTREALQRKGTKSARRRLKKIENRENRWMTDVNHCLSKTLVTTYGTDTLFVLEDLTGVSFNRDDLPKALRNDNSSWAFYQLEMMLTYKARRQGSLVLKVPANFTSQRCPKCEVINKENRDQQRRQYQCADCGYRSNDDRVGAMNIQTLGQRYVAGHTKPRFKKPKSTKTTVD